MAPMDENPSVSQISHAGVAFANPMSEAAMDAALAALPVPREALILETGCGNGETLLRALRLNPGARGVGVDLDPHAIAEARERADGLPVDFEIRDAGTVDGEFDVVMNVASSHAHGGPGRPGLPALPGARGPLRRGVLATAALQRFS
jgi:SAM-dependent methyltransferase